MVSRDVRIDNYIPVDVRVRAGVCVWKKRETERERDEQKNTLCTVICKMERRTEDREEGKKIGEMNYRIETTIWLGSCVVKEEDDGWWWWVNGWLRFDGLVLFVTREVVVVRITLFSSLDREYLVMRRLIKSKTDPVTINVIPTTFIVCRLHLNVDDDERVEDNVTDDGSVFVSSSLLIGELQPSNWKI